MAPVANAAANRMQSSRPFARDSGLAKKAKTPIKGTPPPPAKTSQCVHPKYSTTLAPIVDSALAMKRRINKREQSTSKTQEHRSRPLHPGVQVPSMRERRHGCQGTVPMPSKGLSPNRKDFPPNAGSPIQLSPWPAIIMASSARRSVFLIRSESDLSWPQAARMSRPRGVRIGEA